MKIIKTLSLWVVCLDVLPIRASQIPKIKTLDDLPAYCAAYANLLQQQPTVEGIIWKRAKKIMVNTESCSLFCTITRAASQLLDNTQRWKVFGTFYDMIELEIVDDTVPCSIDSLIEAYQKVIKQVKSNWIKAQTNDYSAVAVKPKIKEDWELFIQQDKELEVTPLLIRAFLYHDPLFYTIECYNEWENPAYFHRPYIWIKKDSLEAVQARLQLLIE